MAASSKNLFVDSNVFLSFYSFSNDDLDELQKLVELVKNGEIVMFVTGQVTDEINRNRDNKIQEAYKRFRELDLRPSFPQMCKGYPEYESIRKKLREAEEELGKLDQKLSADIEEYSLKADLIIAELLQKSHSIDTSGVVDKGHQRYITGNPPGKNDSYGDAITWEGLLADVPDGETLYFVSDDKDFKSPLGNGRFNSFLLQEWRTKKDAEIVYYNRLSTFFAEHHKEIALRLEEEKKKWIEALSISGSFASTHLIIRRLNGYEFTDDDIVQMVEAALANDQVSSIMTDIDLQNFFGKILSQRGDVLSETAREDLAVALSDPEED